MIKHLKQVQGHWKTESRHSANPAATGATRGCQLTTCGANDDNGGSPGNSRLWMKKAF